MKIDLSHSKNPAVGWDIQVVATADVGEKISFARITVNGFPELQENVDPQVEKWQRSLTQQGQFPGENKVLVTITNDKEEDTTDEDEWE